MPRWTAPATANPGRARAHVGRGGAGDRRRVTGRSLLDLADRFHRGPGGHRPVGTAGGADPLEAVNAATNALELDTEEGVVAVESSGLRVLAAAARYHDALNGAICIARAPDAGPWDEDTTTLLEGVGDHLGIAIAQIESHEKLEELSRTD